jgi:alpha-D-ribose 1-methylphosphonate 5-triphosphate diphosphatase
LAERGTVDLAQAWEMISTRPAQIMDLKDRGSLCVGSRADVVIVDPQTHAVEATIAGGRLAYAHGSVGRRLMGGWQVAAQ